MYVYIYIYIHTHTNPRSSMYHLRAYPHTWEACAHHTHTHTNPTAILIIIEGQFQIFQRLSSSKLVLKTVESCFTVLNYYENGSMTYTCTFDMSAVAFSTIYK